MSRNFAFVFILSLILALGTVTGTAMAEYPERPIQLICPYGAGGGTDAVSRMIATLLKKELGVPVNVVNRTGGSGVVGHTAIATAKPDGYTIGMPVSEIDMMHWMGLTDLTYRDMTFIALVNADFAAINVRPDSFGDYAELIDQIKSSPGKLAGSGVGRGGPWHLAMAGWLQSLGLDTTDVKWIPSKGAAPALQDLMAKGIDMAICSLPEAATLIDAGKVKPLAVMSDQRNPIYPDVPTLKELGSDWTFAVWRGIAAPKGTPKEITAVLEAAVAKVYKSAEFQEFMKNRGFGMIWMGSSDFTEYVASSDESFGEVMKAAGLIK